jgi:hypothetical protein
MEEKANGDYPRFTGYPDVSVYLAMEKTLHPQKWWSWSGISAIVFLISFAVVLLQKTLPVAIIVIATLTTGGLIACSYWLGTRLGASHRRKTYRTAIEQEPRTGWVAPDGIHIRISGGETDLGWDYFTGRLDLNGAIGLYKGKYLVDGFTLAMFGSPAEWEKAKQIIQNGVRKGSGE